MCEDAADVKNMTYARDLLHEAFKSQAAFTTFLHAL